MSIKEGKSEMKKFKSFMSDLFLGILCTIPFIAMFIMWLVMGY